MTEVKKKRVVRKAAPRIDPAKVKKPICNVHTTRKMEFSVVRNVFACPEEGCTQIARPKKDPDDRSVTIGKGSVSLRIIKESTESDVVLILVSDDNIALDVTAWVNLEKVMGESGVVEMLAEAAKSGLQKFNMPVPVNLSVSLPAAVFGAELF